MSERLQAVIDDVADVVEEHPQFCVGFAAGLLACAVAFVGVAVVRALLS